MLDILPNVDRMIRFLAINVALAYLELRTAGLNERAPSSRFQGNMTRRMRAEQSAR